MPLRRGKAPGGPARDLGRRPYPAGMEMAQPSPKVLGPERSVP